MKAGLRTHQATGKIDYKQLRKINPEAARWAILEYLRTNGGNISDAARVFDINCPVVYDILRKQKGGNLKDRPRTPKRQPNKTPPDIEARVIETKNQTYKGPIRLSLDLAKEGICVSPRTIRHTPRRDKDQIACPLPLTGAPNISSAGLAIKRPSQSFDQPVDHEQKQCGMSQHIPDRLSRSGHCRHRWSAPLHPSSPRATATKPSTSTAGPLVCAGEASML